MCIQTLSSELLRHSWGELHIKSHTACVETGRLDQSWSFESTTLLFPLGVRNKRDGEAGFWGGGGRCCSGPSGAWPMGGTCLLQLQWKVEDCVLFESLVLASISDLPFFPGCRVERNCKKTLKPTSAKMNIAN